MNLFINCLFYKQNFKMSLYFDTLPDDVLNEIAKYLICGPTVFNVVKVHPRFEKILNQDMIYLRYLQTILLDDSITFLQTVWDCMLKDIENPNWTDKFLIHSELCAIAYTFTVQGFLDFRRVISLKMLRFMYNMSTCIPNLKEYIYTCYLPSFISNIKSIPREIILQIYCYKNRYHCRFVGMPIIRGIVPDDIEITVGDILKVLILYHISTIKKL